MANQIVTVNLEDPQLEAPIKEMKDAIWLEADVRNYGRVLPKELFEEGKETFVYMIDGRMVGYITWRWELGVGYILATGVHPDFRRRGIARELKFELERRARLYKCHKLMTETGVGWDSTLMNLSLGYQHAVVLEDHYANIPFHMSYKFLV